MLEIIAEEGFSYANSPLLKGVIKETPQLDAMMPEIARMVYESGRVAGVTIGKIVVRAYMLEPDDVHKDFWAEGVFLDVVTALPEPELISLRNTLGHEINLYEQELNDDERVVWREKMSFLIR